MIRPPSLAVNRTAPARMAMIAHALGSARRSSTWTVGQALRSVLLVGRPGNVSCSTLLRRGRNWRFRGLLGNLT